MEVEIIIVDNDAVVGRLAEELLQDVGYSTLLLHDSRKVIQVIKDLKPRAVLLDIMMPGIDGLTLCRAIKADPETRDIKVILASGKVFTVEKERATRFGADLFIQKPFGIKEFKGQISAVVGQPTRPASNADTPLPRKAIKVKFWGVRSGPRGASAAPQEPHTPCVSVEFANHFFIFDAGSGIIPLGEELEKTGTQKEIWLFLSHAHPAHVEGLGFFGPARNANVQLHIGGPNDPEKSLENTVRDVFQTSFESNPRPIEANIHLYVLQEGEYDLLPGVRVSPFYANHPTTTLGYRLDFGGRSLVYCPDSEIFGPSTTAFNDYDEALAKKCRSIDLLIHDARYHPKDYESHKHEGHSGLLQTLDFAIAHDVGRLLLFHADSSYSPSDLEAMTALSREHLKSKNSNLAFQIATEGLSLEF